MTEGATGTGVGGATGARGGAGGLTVIGIWIGVSRAKEWGEMGVEGFVVEATSEVSEGARFFFHAARMNLPQIMYCPMATKGMPQRIMKRLGPLGCAN